MILKVIDRKYINMKGKVNWNKDEEEEEEHERDSICFRLLRWRRRKK